MTAKTEVLMSFKAFVTFQNDSDHDFNAILNLNHFNDS